MDVISCGSLQIRFMLSTEAANATRGDWDNPHSAESEDCLTTLREELAQRKSEQEHALATLEQQSRELAGANAENRELRQGLELLRSQHAALRREQEETRGVTLKAEAQLAVAIAEGKHQNGAIEQLTKALHALRAELTVQTEARHQAEQESQRLKERVTVAVLHSQVLPSANGGGNQGADRHRPAHRKVRGVHA
jgi:chromosome segregation ATPase